MNRPYLDTNEKLSEVFNLAFLSEVKITKLIQLGEQLQLRESSIKTQQFPLRFARWLLGQTKSASYADDVQLRDVLDLTSEEVKNAANIGQKTIEELYSFLKWLEHLVEVNAVDFEGNPIIELKFDTDSLGEFENQYFLASGKPLNQVIPLEGIENSEIIEIWTKTNEVTLYGRSYLCEKPIPIRFYNLFLSKKNHIKLFDAQVNTFSDLLKLNRKQLKSIKGISTESEQLLFEHLIWLAEANKHCRRSSSFNESLDLISGRISVEEKYILEKRSVFSGISSFKEIQSGLKHAHGMSITGEGCRRKLLAAEVKIEKILNQPGHSEIFKIYEKIDVFLKVQRSLREIENELHILVCGSDQDLNCRCEYCLNVSQLALSVYSSLRINLRFSDEKFFLDGYGIEDIKRQLFFENGVVESTRFIEFCNDRKLETAQLISDLVHCGITQIGTFMVDSKPMTNFFEAALRMENRPISIDECIEKYQLKLNARSFRNAVAYDERFVRVSKDEYAFADSGFEAYEGIAREMEKHIEKSGRVLLSSLQSELHKKKGINSTSILFYSTAPVFLVENGFISVRDSSSSLRVFPKEVEGESRIVASGEIELRFLCDKELLRGSGISLGPGTSALLGVQPGGSRTYLFGEHEIEISWSKYSMNPRISSLRNVAQFLNATRSNMLRIIFYESMGSAEARVTPA